MFLLLFIIFHFLLHSFDPPFAQSFLDACVPDIPGQNISWSLRKKKLTVKSSACINFLHTHKLSCAT